MNPVFVPTVDRRAGEGVSGTANNKHRAIISRMFMRSIKTGDFDAIHKAFTGMRPWVPVLPMHAGHACSEWDGS